jgi:hypothetical protein
VPPPPDLRLKNKPRLVVGKKKEGGHKRTSFFVRSGEDEEEEEEILESWRCRLCNNYVIPLRVENFRFKINKKFQLLLLVFFFFFLQWVFFWLQFWCLVLPLRKENKLSLCVRVFVAVVSCFSKQGTGKCVGSSSTMLFCQSFDRVAFCFLWWKGVWGEY